MNRIKVLIADDHDLFIDGLTALLNDVPDIEFIGRASSGSGALELVDSNPGADLFILDISMPEGDGIEVAKELRRRKFMIPLLALTQNSDGGSISRAMRAGMSGYLLKSAGRDEFAEAIRAVAAGEQYFSEPVRESLIYSMTGRDDGRSEKSLTKREKEILTLIAEEMTTNEIAEKLFLSPYTVETHRKKLIQKLGVRNLAGLVRYAVEHGLTG